MLKVGVVVIGWYFMVFGVSTTHIKEKSNRTEIPLLDKFHQHDYKLKFERVELVRYDNRYMNSIKIITFKYNRTSPVVNITQLNFKVDVGYDIETITQVYKFASNEYRLFPLRLQLNYCESWKKNIMGMANAVQCGNFGGCSVLKGRMNYTICNWAPDPNMLPPFFPNGQYKAEIELWHRSNELFVVAGFSTVYRPIWPVD